MYPVVGSLQISFLLDNEIEYITPSDICQHQNYIFFKKLKQHIQNSIAKLNSTPIWNSILQIFFLSTVEFNLSELSVKILYKYGCFLPAGRIYL